MLFEVGLHPAKEALSAPSQHRVLLPAYVVGEKLCALEAGLTAKITERRKPAYGTLAEQTAARASNLTAPRERA